MKNEDSRVKVKECDFLVIGSGIAGLTFALRTSDHAKVLVVTKGKLSDANTSWAQGGVAAAVGEDDSWRLHEEDTLRAGAGLCDPVAVRFLVQNARPVLEWLISIGAQFDFTDNHGLPHLALAREGGHSRSRIVHHADQSGAEIQRALTEAVKKQPAIEFWEHTFCESLGMRDNRCTGAFVYKKDEGRYEIRARSVLLGTGSCCWVYRYTTNPPIATGDGVALASSSGAEIRDMEFIQFHPTTLYHPRGRNFLISEIVRGAGAVLRNSEGKRFMLDYDPRAELAPRDIVARAIYTEMTRTKQPCVYLDLTHLDPKQVRKMFPGICDRLAKYGFDITKQLIPVIPAAHYQCGGVHTDLNGRTNITDLYASGEVAHTGVHGANRLASNSLLEALVFSFAAAEHAPRHAGNIERGEFVEQNVPPVPPDMVPSLVKRLRNLMWEKAGIVRSNKGLEEAANTIHEMIEAVRTRHRSDKDKTFLRKGSEAANMLECARLIVQAAIARKENVGLHYNIDLDTSAKAVVQKASTP
ncbi:MAG TPA: L-aspartate oxidase [Fimbriimonadales bacterium]|nr:L-aspartate oxidase [Fimbriimonadales bacterium]